MKNYIITDEAVQAAASAVEFPIRGMNGLRLAITAALTFLQGVKVKALEWVGKTEIKAKAIIGTYLIDQFAEKFRLYSLDRSSYQWFDTLEAAKAAAQADYAARVRSAIEVSAPAPSPRAQALEEAAQVAEQFRNNDWIAHDMRTGVFPKQSEPGVAIAAAIRALSSQPVADGWLPIETAPKGGTQFLAYDKANGYYNCWWHKSMYGEEYWMDEADTEPNPTHWRPLPSTPGASE